MIICNLNNRDGGQVSALKKNTLMPTSEDGINWANQGELLTKKSDVSRALYNLRESELVASPDGLFKLFFTNDMNNYFIMLNAINRTGHHSEYRPLNSDTFPHHPPVPGSPFIGPTISGVTHPP